MGFFMVLVSLLVGWVVNQSVRWEGSYGSLFG